MADKLYAGLLYDEAVRKYAQTVQSVCIVRLRSLADAEDCMQNTFIKLYTKAPDFKSEEHLKAWLLKVAINECNQFFRANRRHLSLDEIHDIPLPQSLDELDISWALMKLEPKYREVLYLYYGERYTSEQIAKILGKNHNTVRTMLRRGREKLKMIYGGGVDE